MEIIDKNTSEGSVSNRTTNYNITFNNLKMDMYIENDGYRPNEM
jgi:hypothetical protein